MSELAKTEIMGCVTIRVFYKNNHKDYDYFIDVDSTSQHQKSWNRKLFTSSDPPDGDVLAYCFFIHKIVIKHIQKTLRKKTSNLLKKIQYRRLYDAQGGLCYLCSNEMSIYDCSIDHVIPKSLGGKDKMSNKLLTHSRCNSEKANRMPTKNELDILSEVHSKAKSLEYYKIIK